MPKLKKDKPKRFVYECPSCPHGLPKPGRCDVCGRRLNKVEA